MEAPQQPNWMPFIVDWSAILGTMITAIAFVYTVVHDRRTANDKTSDRTKERTRSQPQQRRTALFKSAVIVLIAISMICLYDGIRVLRTNSYLNQGNSLYQQQKFAEAIVMYRKAVAADPKSTEANINLALALQANKNGPEAIEQFRQALKLAPRDYRVLVDYGLALFEQDDYPQAEAAYRAAIAIAPHYADAHNNLGVVLKQLKRPDEALKEYQAGLQLDPNNVETHYNCGILLADMGRVNEAIEQLHKADQNYSETHVNLGNLFSKQGKFDLAVAEYRQAKALAADSTEAAYNYGLALVQNGQKAEAIDALQDYLRLAQDRPVETAQIAQAQQMLNRLRSGQ